MKTFRLQGETGVGKPKKAPPPTEEEGAFCIFRAHSGGTCEELNPNKKVAFPIMRKGYFLFGLCNETALSCSSEEVSIMLCGE